MEVTGTLKVKFDTQKVSDRFQKREFVLTTEASTPYPQHVSFQLTNDKVSLLDQYNIGDEMKVQFNLRGREWNGPQGIKYFNTLEAWRIEKGAVSNGRDPFQNDAIAANNPFETITAADLQEKDDDLPF